MLLLVCVGCSDKPATDGSQKSNAVDSTVGHQSEDAEKSSQNELAGAYYRGDGLGFNLHLELLTDGTFQCVWTGCLGVYGNCSGTWQQSDDRIEIKTTSADGMFENRSIGDLEIIRNDGKNVLVPVDEREFYDDWGPSRCSCFSRTE